MILEGIVTTMNAAGEANIAPMGPLVDGPDFRRFILRPFPTAQTYRNLKAHGEGVLHVTDDVLLLARAAIGAVDPLPSMRPAEHVRGFVLADACRYFEFRVMSMDESAPRVQIDAEVVHAGRLRDFFGFNRAKHAVLEAAILATRTALLPRPVIEAEYERLETLVKKTGGEAELAAFDLLRRHVQP